MEKFFLCTFFSYNKLNIVDQKNVIIAIFLAECGHCQFISVLTYFKSIDQFIRKSFTCYIQYFFGGIMFQNVMCHGVHQMGLSKSNTLDLSLPFHKSHLHGSSGRKILSFP